MLDIKKVENWALGDRLRFVLLPILLVILAALGADFGRLSGEVDYSYDRAVRFTADSIGREVVLPYAWVRSIGPRSFHLWHSGKDVEVLGHLPRLKVGASASVRGIFMADHRLTLVEGYVHRGRRLKWRLGFWTTIAVTLLLLGDILITAWTRRRARRG